MTTVTATATTTSAASTNFFFRPILPVTLVAFPLNVLLSGERSQPKHALNCRTTQLLMNDNNATTTSTALASSSQPFSQPWAPFAMAAGCSILLLSFLVLVCMCCKKVEKIVEGDVTATSPTTPATTTTTCTTFCSPPDLSPISKSNHDNSEHNNSNHSDHNSSDHGNNNNNNSSNNNNKNSFSFSPKATFPFPPSKPTSLIFSFSSPKKCGNNEIIYPTMEGGALDVSSPYRVQPQLDLLFPPSRESPLSGGSGDEKQRTLLQSRRGSSASLIIDLSPKSPLQDNVLVMAESPTEEILKKKSRKISYRTLRRYKEDSNLLYEEFSNIPPNTVSRKGAQVGFSLKNRYPDIIPNKWSSVRLEDSANTPVYINANIVSGFDMRFDEYIATQGPLPCTVDDFWLMIWKFECSVITMITKLREKHKDKCVQYWPSESCGQERYGDVVVTYDSQVERDGYTRTTLYISYKGSEESRKVTHFWFTSWPDHKVPNDTRPILSLIQEVRELQKTCNTTIRSSGRAPDTPTTPLTTSTHTCPVTVHCSAGRGRTGCFIAISMGMSQIDNEDNVDILKIVSRIRIYRGGLVDKVHQYIFLHKALYDYWTLKHGSNVTSPMTSPLLMTSPDITTTLTLQDSNDQVNSDDVRFSDTA